MAFGPGELVAGETPGKTLIVLAIQYSLVCALANIEGTARLVANGVGVALVPQTAIHRRWPAVVRVIDLGSRTFHRDIGLVHRANHGLGEPARLFTQLVGDAYCGKAVTGDSEDHR